MKNIRVGTRKFRFPHGSTYVLQLLLSQDEAERVIEALTEQGYQLWKFISGDYYFPLTDHDGADVAGKFLIVVYTRLFKQDEDGFQQIIDELIAKARGRA